LEQINKSAQTTLESISDLIWSVKPHTDFLNDMADRVREYCGKVLESQDIAYKINIPRLLPILELEIETRRNIYLLFKEAINNAVKHSNCSTLDISLDANKEHISLRVADNGIGFVLAEKQAEGNGQGLRNLFKRARDIGGELKIDSTPGKGTLVEFKLPLIVQTPANSDTP
jgi:signal transduction histidine kinase